MRRRWRDDSLPVVRVYGIYMQGVGPPVVVRSAGRNAPTPEMSTLGTVRRSLNQGFHVRHPTLLLMRTQSSFGRVAISTQFIVPLRQMQRARDEVSEGDRGSAIHRFRGQTTTTEYRQWGHYSNLERVGAWRQI